MANTKTTIELNGKLYDATTGHAMDGGAAIQPSATNTPTAGTSVDGFFRTPTSAATPTQPLPKPQAARSPAPIQAHQPEHPKTLMRSAVSKPASPPTTSSPAAAPTPPASSTDSLPTTIAKERLDRANSIPQSSSISRFSFSGAPAVSKRVESLPVQPHPEETARQTVAQAQPQPADQPSLSGAQLFENELQNSTSHRQAPIKKNKRLKNSTKLALASVLVVIVGSFGAFLALPSLEVKLAGNRAGFSAAVPHYVPAGFALSDSIKAIPGQVTLNFHSNSDGRNFQVIQKPSDWTSQSLLDNFVLPANSSYQTIEAKGNTVYKYGNNATWVSNGVWYQVQGNTSLSSNQLLQIINSL